MKNYSTEASLQKAVVQYLKLKHPTARYCASLGGQYQKFKSQRMKAKETGYVAGFPDLQITEPRGKFHGLFIEIKLDKRCYASQYQKDWVNDLNERGYRAVICKGLDECLEAIDFYFNLKPNQ